MRTSLLLLSSCLHGFGCRAARERQPLLGSASRRGVEQTRQGYCSAERRKTCMEAKTNRTAKPASTARLAAASAVSEWLPQIDCRPLGEPPTRPCRISASACVEGKTLATPASPFGSTSIGKSEPAKNQGTIAIAGMMPTYSSCED